jgi:hypothetical protein
LIVAIGPNNGGKSRFLREVSQAIVEPHLPRLALSSVGLDRSWIIARARKLTTAPGCINSEGHYVLDTVSADLTAPQQARHLKTQTDALLSNTSTPIDQLTSIVGRHLVAHLTTETRLALVKRQINRQENIQGFQSTIHAAFIAGPRALDVINPFVRLAFNRELVLDRSDLAVAEFRLSPPRKRPPDGTDVAAMQKLSRLDEQGDGIRAFCGILVAVALVDRPLVLVDEPEAFLHPPQAFLLGQALAALRGRGHQFVIATHSSDVLRGLLSRTADLEIIRFARQKGAFGRTHLPPAALQRLLNDPVLSSARVLDGLFYEGVIVTEADGDVVLYRRALEQLGLDGAFHFVNSYSKQASVKVAAPYAAMGVPHAIIVDFDALRVREEFRQLAEGVGAAWATIETPYEKLLSAIEGADTPEHRLGIALAETEAAKAAVAASAADAGTKVRSLRRSLGAIRESASEWSQLKSRGCAGLDDKGQSAFKALDGMLRMNGAFVVPVGEREAWLPDRAPYSKNKNRWTIAALAALQNALPDDHPLRVFMQNVSDYLRA